MKIIGIAGGSGSGKTTFAKKVLNKIGAENSFMLSMDSYYLDKQPEEFYSHKGNPNFDHPAAFDWELLNSHISALKNGQAIEAPEYDFSHNARSTQTTTVQPKKVIIFEGIFTLFDKEIRKMLDIKCFLHVDSDIRFTRRLHRDVKERGRSLESVIAQYHETVRPMYQKYLEPQKQYADFTVGEETDVAADILASKLRDYLA